MNGPGRTNATDGPGPERSAHGVGGVVKGFLFGCGGVVLGAAAVVALLVAMVWWGCKSLEISPADRATSVAIQKTAGSLALRDVDVSATPQRGRTDLYVLGIETPAERSLFLHHLGIAQAKNGWTPIWVRFAPPSDGAGTDGLVDLYLLENGEVRVR